MERMLAVLACAGVAFAATAASADESKVTVVRIKGPSMDAMKVAKDKDTGKIRAATPEEIAEMGNARTLGPTILSVARPTTTMVQRADGSATIRRSLDDLDSLTAARTADGKLSVGHGKHAAPVQTKPTE